MNIASARRETMKKQAFTRLAMLSLFVILASLMLSTSTKWQSIEAQSTKGTLALTAITPSGFNAWSSNGPEGASINSLTIDPGNPSIIYAGTFSNGIFKSTNGGTSWSATGLTGTYVNSLTIDASNANIIYAVVKGMALFKSADGGASWNRADKGLPDGLLGAPVIDLRNSNTLYVGIAFSRDGGVYKSTNGGAKWKKTSINLDNAQLLVLDAVNPNIIYATSFYQCCAEYYYTTVFKSTDEGANWIKSNSGLPDDLSVPDSSDPPLPGPLVIDPANTNIIYAAGTDGSVFKSINGGTSWTELNNGLPSAFVSVLVIDPANTNTIYAGTGKGVFFKSTDGGASWSPLNNGLPDRYGYALVIDASGTFLHVGTQAGVFDYQVNASCDYSISPASQSFEVSGGTGSINVTASGECSWTGVSYDGGISFTSGNSGSSGNGTVSYSVAANNSTHPRTSTLFIATRSFTVTQAALPVAITGANVIRKSLLVFGEKFDIGAVILLNGAQQNTVNDGRNPETVLISKKTGKKIKTGDKLQVLNHNGTMSQEFIFTRF